MPSAAADHLSAQRGHRINAGQQHLLCRRGRHIRIRGHEQVQRTGHKRARHRRALQAGGSAIEIGADNIHARGRQTEGGIYFGRQHLTINKLELSTQIALRLFVDGLEVPCPAINLGETGFSEVVLRVPAEFIQSEAPRIQIVGDHVSYAYWFYQ